MSPLSPVRATTVDAVQRDNAHEMASYGQVQLVSTVLKQGAQKVRRASRHPVLIGFAGGAADAFALGERLEAQLDAQRGNVARAAVELAKDWRSDRVLRRLEAMLLVGDAERMLVISGNGDVIEPDDGAAAMGSGAAYALAAARALLRHTKLGSAEIASEALRLAAEICIYTNDRIQVVTLP